MKATYIYGAGDVRVIDVPNASLKGPGDAVVRTIRACICGSDLHPYHSMPASSAGRPIGHEATGVITELGPAATCKGLKVGDRVVYYYNEHCGSCYYCRNGQEQFCENMTGTSAALNRAWASNTMTPAVVASGVPTPNSTTMKPSWLTVP